MSLGLALRILVVLASVPATWLWLEGGQAAYGRLFSQLALPLYSLVGLTDIVPNGDRQRFINYLPFLVLMLITPATSWRRRGLAILGGLVVLFLGQLVFAAIVGASDAGGTQTVLGFQSSLPAVIFCDALPFVLWILLAGGALRERAARLFAPPGAAAPTDEPPGGSPGD